MFCCSAPQPISLPERVSGSTCATSFFEMPQAFTHYITACTLVGSPYVTLDTPDGFSLLRVTSMTGLRLLPAGAVAGWDLHHWKNAAFSRRTPCAAITKLWGKLAYQTGNNRAPFPLNRPNTRDISRRKASSFFAPGASE